jgi:preprotein translocase subunit SecA
MMKRIRENTIEYIFKVQVDVKPHNQEPAKITSDFKKNKNKKKQIDPKNLNKIGRNDICPCGSGKKYKKCCGV